MFLSLSPRAYCTVSIQYEDSVGTQRMPIASELSNLLSELRDALSFLSASLRRTFAESIFVATLVPGTLCRPQHALRYSGEDHQQLIPRYPGLQRRLLVGR